MLTFHQRGLVAFISEQFHGKNINQWNDFEKYTRQITITSPRGQWVNRWIESLSWNSLELFPHRVLSHDNRQPCFTSIRMARVALSMFSVTNMPLFRRTCFTEVVLFIVNITKQCLGYPINETTCYETMQWHDDVIKWKCSLCAGNPSVTGEFPSERPMTRSIMFSLMYAWTNGWANSPDAGDLRCHGAHCGVILVDLS